MLGTSVDVENEFADISREVELLGRALSIFRTDQSTEDEARIWLSLQGLASAVEKIYTGCERVMALIASGVDGARIDRREGWHVSLLKRMSHPFGNARAPVISQDTYALLDQLRSFRHRERNTYGLTLDARIVVERALQTADAFDAFRADVRLFFASKA